MFAWTALVGLGFALLSTVDLTYYAFVARRVSFELVEMRTDWRPLLALIPQGYPRRAAGVRRATHRDQRTARSPQHAPRRAPETPPQARHGARTSPPALMTGQDLLPLLAEATCVAEPSPRVTTSFCRLHSLDLTIEGSLLEVKVELLVDLLEWATA